MKEQLLYHIILPRNHDYYVPLNELLEKGITPSTHSNYWYRKGGNAKLAVTERLRPFHAPKWLDFKKAIGVNLDEENAKTVRFPIFTQKIMVFDSAISMLIYDQVFFEDNQYSFEEALDFDTGEDLDELIKKYWNSMLSLEDYFRTIPYEQPEVLLFESVPANIITLGE